ncbi:uncharacterized protein TNCV_1937461 [Trichonephila clavipes]|nr:uncharacterized protein TNCV_1937461 [Trichonephila clavipes]
MHQLKESFQLVIFGPFTCRNCGGGDRGRVAIYRPFGEVSLSLNRTVTCMVLKANDRRTSCPCHDEFRGPRSDYVRQYARLTSYVKVVTPKCLGGPPVDRDRLNAHPGFKVADKLANRTPPANMVDEASYRLEAVWNELLISVIQAQFNSKPNWVRAVLAAKVRAAVSTNLPPL